MADRVPHAVHCLRLISYKKNRSALCLAEFITEHRENNGQAISTLGPPPLCPQSC